jgi:hypothetical protein
MAGGKFIGIGFRQFVAPAPEKDCRLATVRFEQDPHPGLVELHKNRLDAHTNRPRNATGGATVAPFRAVKDLECQLIEKYVNPFHAQSLVEGEDPGPVFALFYVSAGGSRAFFGAVHDKYQAETFGRLLSRRDARDVVVIDSSGIGDTAVHATFRSGERLEHVPEDMPRDAYGCGGQTGLGCSTI